MSEEKKLSKISFEYNDGTKEEIVDETIVGFTAKLFSGAFAFWNFMFSTYEKTDISKLN